MIKTMPELQLHLSAFVKNGRCVFFLHAIQFSKTESLTLAKYLR